MNILKNFIYLHTLAFKKTLFFLPFSIKKALANILSYIFVFVEILTLSLVVFIISFSLFLSTSQGTKFLTDISQKTLASLSSEDMGGLVITVGELSFVDGLSLKDFSLNDSSGPWLEIGSFYLDFSPLQIISLFSKAEIQSITADKVSFYRIPTFSKSKEEKNSQAFIIPKSVLPLPLGEIIVKNIEITNAFVGAEVMSLESFDMDLNADIKLSAHLKRQEANFIVEIDEKNTYVQGTIDYFPGKIIADLNANDEIWGKTFPLINEADLDIEATVTAVQFPLTKDFPLEVDLQAGVEFYNITWLQNNLSSSLGTHFIFDGESVIFEHTELIDERAHIYIPYFALNIDTFLYEEAEAIVNIDDLSSFSPLFQGSVHGELYFWGSVFDMHTKSNFVVDNFLFALSNEKEELFEYIQSPSLETNLSGRILIENKLDIQGDINIESNNVSLLNKGQSTFLSTSSKFQLSTSDFALKNLLLSIQDIDISSNYLSLNFDYLIKGDYLSMLDGKLDISTLSLNSLIENFPISGLGKLEIDLSQTKNDTISTRFDFTELNFNELYLDSLQAFFEIDKLNRITKMQIPQIKGEIISSSLYTHNEISSFLPSSLYESGYINFQIESNNLSLDLNTEGELALNSKLEYALLSSEMLFNEFSFFYKKSNQELVLQKPLKLSFSNQFTLDEASFEILDHSTREKGNLSFTALLSQEVLDLKLNSTLPLDLFNSYYPGNIPGKSLQFQLDLSGSRYNPTGKASLMLDEVIVTQNEVVNLILEGTIENKEFDFLASIGTENQAELEGKGIIPLMFEPYPFIDLNKSFQSELVWKGNLATLWRFAPFAQSQLEGNGMLELKAEGTFDNPLIIGKAYTSKARFTDESLGFIISDIDLEADINLENTSINIYARDGTNTSSQTASTEDKNALIINAKIYKENDVYQLDTLAAMSEFSPLKRDDLSLTLNGRLNTNGPLTNPAIGGVINILEGSYIISQFDGTSINNLDNVHILKNMNSFREEETQTSLFDPYINVRVNIHDYFEVSGLGLQSVWGGNLNLFGSLSSPLLIGTLEPKSGSLDFLGKEFELSRSLISFTGSLSVPIYDINVERTNEASNSLVRISGAGSNIKLELSSIPPLPTDEVIARMFFAKPLAELTQFEAIQVATTAAQLLSPELNKLDVLSATKQALGLHVLRLNSLDKDDDEGDVDILNEASIEAGTYINERIYLGVERGIEDTAVRVEVELFPSIKAEGRIGTDSSQAGIKWSDDY